MKLNAKTIARLILGLGYTIFSLNFFFHFFPLPQPPEAMGKIEGAIFATGYWFQFVKITELVGGLLLLSGLFVPLAIVILAPVTLNIIVMHLFLDPAGMAPALVLFILNVYLGLAYIKYYKPMLQARTE